MMNVEDMISEYQQFSSNDEKFFKSQDKSDDYEDEDAET